jgi:hypothetical protein
MVCYSSHLIPLPNLRRNQAAQQSQGIQTLLEAEKEAAKIVEQARLCRSSFNYGVLCHKSF